MSQNLAALLYLDLRRPVHPRAARAVQPGDEPSGQPVRHDRHGDRDRGDARVASAGELLLVAAGPHRARDRRRRGRGDRAARADDRDAGTGRGVPLAGRHGGGAGRGGRALCAARLRHRRARRYSAREPGRDVARRRDRRDHVHRLDDRVPQALRAHERRADHAADAPRDQSRAVRRDRAADDLVRAHRELFRVLAAHARVLRCSASCSSSRSAAPTCRS